MVNHFASQFALTEEEQRELVVERGNASLLRTTKFLLVGKVLAKKPFNKEAFKRTMVTLWRPKARVEIVTLEDDLLMFAFSLRQDRVRILGWVPWTFNHYLIVMREADDVVNPSRIPLHKHEFWIQIRGLPLVYMMRAMGKEIGTTLGDFVVTDQSKRTDCYGSYLRIKVGIDISKPLRRCMPVRLPGGQTTTQWVDLPYEKLPQG
ncbi:hypothetical protein L3X38_016848 [Prunus dulcis]|uniref:DUF4283 domain-containing protein n=1 Tax=Prunus dulcis TaxID=3755 RepID=A0AAD4W8Q8_PRUDU|nr:hypothetical protein L3X38_016848 [Prunus dulcis]